MSEARSTVAACCFESSFDRVQEGVRLSVAVVDDLGRSRERSDVEPPPGEDFGRQPPQDPAAEQAVLGGMLLSKDAVADVLERLRPGDFYRPANQLVYDAILDLYSRGEPADAVTVAAELDRRGLLRRVGGAPYLHTLISTVPTAANAGYYAGRYAVLMKRLGVDGRPLPNARTGAGGVALRPSDAMLSLLASGQRRREARRREEREQSAADDERARVTEEERRGLAERAQRNRTNQSGCTPTATPLAPRRAKKERAPPLTRAAPPHAQGPARAPGARIASRSSRRSWTGGTAGRSPTATSCSGPRCR